MAESHKAIRAAIRLARENNEQTESFTGKAIVSIGSGRFDKTCVRFTDGVGLAAEELINEHGFKIRPDSASKKEVTLYK